MNRYVLSLLLILLCFTASAQNHRIDSLRIALSHEKEDTNMSKTLNSLASALFNMGEYDSTLFYADRAKTIAERIGFERGLAAIYCNLANATSYKGNNAKGIEYASKALEISKKYNIARLQAFANNILGFTYMGVENYPKAIGAFSEGISVCQKSGDKRNLCACLANLGLIYAKENNNAKALTYDSMALATAMEMGNPTVIYTLQNNIGQLYFSLGNYKKAREYYELSFASGQKFGDKLIMYAYYSNIGEIYIQEGNYQKALDSKNTALSIIRETEKRNDITKAYSEVGQMYNKLKNYTLAKAYIDSSLSISNSIGEVEISRDGYHALYVLDSAKGDIKNELEDYKKYLFYRDSLANELSDKKMAQAEMNYNFARKMDSAQAAQDKLNLVAETEKGRQKVIEYALGGGLTLAFAASGIFFFQRRRISKERQKLKESNEVKDKLFSIISHDLRSPLNLLNGMLGLFRRGKVTAENSEALSQNLEGSMQSTMNLLDNLLSWSHSQMKGFNIKPEKLNLAEVTNDVVTLYSNSARQKGIAIETDLPAVIELDADKNVIKLVLRNLLNNAIKFSNSGGKIIISTFKQNGYTGFSVKDNGIGIPATSLDTLFKLGDNKKVREGTNEEQGSGLGLVLCDELVIRSGGEMKVESTEGKGTTISALFPN